ncbi:hypothetical protein FKP32DRAFT_446164 [Trametes sanguinea]|nr:hypothetical protein FKP32DRAFT_446164 [Trametes sanguinea]
MADPNGLYVKFDDRDPNVVYDVFDHVWFDVSDSSAYNQTLSSTGNPGATVSFGFFGSEIVVVGSTAAPPNALAPELVNGGTVTHYVLDDNPSTYTSYTAPVQNASAVTFYSSGPLMGGRHSLTIVVVTASGDFPFFLDYFAVLPANETIQFMPTGTMSSSSTTSSSPSTSAASSSASSSQLSSNSEALAALDPKRIGAIVGGVLGGVVVLAALTMMIWFISVRRRRGWESRYSGVPRDALLDEDKNQPRRAGPESDLHATQIQPFLASPPLAAYADEPPSNAATVYTAQSHDPSAPITTPYGTHHASTLTGTDSLSPPRAPFTLPDIPRISVSSERVFTIANDAGTDANSEHDPQSPRTTPVPAGPLGKAVVAQDPVRVRSPPREPVRVHSDSGMRFDAESVISVQVQPRQPSDPTPEPPEDTADRSTLGSELPPGYTAS